MVLEVNKKLYPEDGQGPGRCWVRFKCPECQGEVILNAYRGQPYHRHAVVIETGVQMQDIPLDPQTVVREPCSADPKGSPRRG